MYNAVILDHFQNPRNLQEMKSPTATGMGASPVCGDVMTLFLSIKDGKVSDARYKTMGCAAAIASGSILTEMLKGKTVDQAKAITPRDLIALMGDLPKIKLHCPDLAIEALKAALHNI